MVAHMAGQRLARGQRQASWQLDHNRRKQELWRSELMITWVKLNELVPTAGSVLAKVQPPAIRLARNC